MKPVLPLYLSAALVFQPQLSAQTATPPATATTLAATSAQAEKRIPLPNTLMDGTPLRLRLGRTISSATEKTGNEVDFETLDQFKVNDVIVIPKGSLVMATVTEADHKKSMGRAGKLDVNIDSVRLADGEKAALRATEGGKAGGHVGAMTGAMVATSIVFFPAAPLFLFIHGKDMTIPKGTEVTAYVNGDFPIDLSKFEAAPANQTATATGNLAQISVDANVPNCDIEVDGAFAGNTPSQLSLPAGNHKIAVSKKGYEPWIKTMMVSGSGVHIQAELEPGAPSSATGVTPVAHQ